MVFNRINGSITNKYKLYQMNKWESTSQKNLPLVLNEIITELDVCGLVLNLSVGLEKCTDPIWVPTRLHTATNTVIEKLYV